MHLLSHYITRYQYLYPTNTGIGPLYYQKEEPHFGIPLNTAILISVCRVSISLHQQALLDCLLVNAFCSHPFRNILFRIPMLEKGKHDIRKGSYSFFNALLAILCGHIYCTERGSLFVQIEIIKPSYQQGAKSHEVDAGALKQGFVSFG